MRFFIKALIFIIIVAIAGLIALPFVIDPNDYKQEITEQVEKATGRQLTLKGDIGLSVFPWVALELGQLSLSNAKGFKADTFANVEAAQVRIKLMPLLSKKLEMDTIILDGLVLNLEKNKNGKTNWDDLTGNSTPATKTTQTNPSSNSASGNSMSLAAITIAGVKLSNANIVWNDASTSQNYQLKNLNLTTEPLVPGEPTAVEMAFDINSEKPMADAHIELNTNISVDLENQHYSLTGLNFSTQAKGQGLPFEKADITLSGDINADMSKQLVMIKDLALSLDANKDKQAINAKLTTSVSSNLATEQSNLNAFKLAAEISDPALPGGKADINISTDVSADMKKQTASLSNLVLAVSDLLINGEINASKIMSDTPNFAGKLNIDPFNLRQLAKKLAIELPVMADDSTLELVKLTTTFTGSTNSFDAKQLALTLDQSNLSGQFALTDFSNPAYRFKLALDEIDADRYLPPVSEEQKTAAPPASAAAAGATQLPLDALRKINAKGTIDVGKLKISGMHSEKIHLEINADKGLIKLNPMSANLYQGQYKGNVNLDARGKVLKLAIDENLSSVQAGPLLKDLSGDDTLSGVANAQVKLTGSGASVEGIKQTLNGQGQFSFKDGALKGVNIAESIRKAKAALKGQTLPDSDTPLRTDFSSLSGSFVATNGIISNQDLLAMSPLLRINGAGKVDLPKEGINYGLKVSIVGTTTGQAGKELAELKGLTIPVKITGTFNKPKPTVDLASILKEQATEKVKAKVSEKLQDKLGGELGGLLGGALGTKPAQEQAPDTPSENTATEPDPAPAKSAEDQAKEALKDKLKSLF